VRAGRPGAGAHGEGASTGDTDAGSDGAPTATMAPPSSGPSSIPLRVGAPFQHYELVRHLGWGGMSSVFLARDTKLGRLVAIKVLREAGAERARRLLNEARLTARCRHENIVVLYEAGELDDGHPYLVLEYIEGVTLLEWLERRERRGPGSARAEPVPPALAVELMRPVLRALAHAHATGIVHRDLKPANIMLTDAGPIKVLDFGIAKRLGDDELAAFVARPPAEGGELTQPGAFLGTLQYMAPEQWRHDPVDARTDLWAAGVILFRLVAGAHPLGTCSLAALADVALLDVPMPRAADRCPELGPLAAIIDRCLSKRPDDRFASADELLAALDALAPTRGPARVAGEAEEGPFAGLSPLQEDDAGRFFGRDREVTAALGRLRAQALLAVAGPSGAGKSSFVRAGLLPAWKRAHPSTETLVLRPGRRPLAALAELLTCLGGRHRRAGRDGDAPGGAAGEGRPGPPDGDEGADRLVDRLAARPGLFGARLRARCAGRRGADRRLLVFVDQFEELYTLGAPPRERAAFLACLLGAADDPSSPLRVVLSLRSDFLDRPAEHPTFAAELARGLVLLPPVGPEGLREALLRPLEAVGYRFEDDALAATMVGELERARCPLPLLQFTAAQLWRERDRERRVLTRAGYERLGGVGGALSAQADATLASLAPAERDLCRALLLRLVTPERTRAVASLAELKALADEPGAVERVLGRLADARLVLLGPTDEAESAEGDGPTVELVHESLVERWGTLARWLDESAHDALFVARLRAAARQWHAAGEAEGLLWRDRAADEARAWVERHGAGRAAGVTGGEARYLKAVVALSQRARRLRRAAVAAVIAALCAVAFAVSGLAWRARREAERANREAGRANREAARVRAEAERADREASAARNVSRLSVAERLLPADPTTALGLLRELEPAAPPPPEWDALARQALHEGVAEAVLEHPDLATSAAFAPDGRRVATGCDDGLVRLWPLGDAGEPTLLRGHEAGVVSVAFRPDGAAVASASRDGTVRLWPANGPGEPTVLRGHAGAVTWVAFSPDGSGRLASASVDGTVRVWPPGGGAPLVLRGHEAGVVSVAFGPDGRRLASASFDRTVRLWPADGSGPPVVLRGHRSSVNFASFSPDGRRVASGSTDRTLRVWNALAPSEPPAVSPLAEGANVTAFSPDGRYLLSNEANDLVIWGAGGAGELRRLRGHSSPVYAASFSPDGRRLLSASYDKTVRVWRAGDLGRTLVWRGHRDAVTAVAFSPDGRRVASGSEDATVRVWNADGSGAPVVLRGHEQPVASLAFGPDGRLLASASFDQTVRVWRADGAGAPVVLRGHQSLVLGVAFRPDGAAIASTSQDRTVRVWPLGAGGQPVVLRGHGDWVYSVDFSPDGRLLATTSGDKTVRVWPADGSGPPLVLPADELAYDAKFSPDGRRLVTASKDGVVRVRPADGAGEAVALRGHQAEIVTADFSPDGRLVVSASDDKTVRVWNADGSGEPAVLRGHGASVAYAVFRPDGRAIASASADHTVRLWAVPAPLAGPDDVALWRASSYCLRPARRTALLQTDEAAARAAFEACERRARAARDLRPNDE
jgi:WD40 repeat protein